MIVIHVYFQNFKIKTVVLIIKARCLFRIEAAAEIFSPICRCFDTRLNTPFKNDMASQANASFMRNSG